MIIKQIDSKDSAIQELESFLESGISKYQRQNIQSEISRLKKGLVGEKQAAYHINQVFPDRFIAHDLRLEVDGDIAQIDHLVINKFGFIILFETKNFSTDVKIDNEGIFHFYDYKRKDFRPFPSPIEQSKRHEKILRKACDKINFIPAGIDHIVIFDHKAKITKPKNGFENVCYPDMIEKTHDKLIDSTSHLSTVISIGNLAKRILKTDSLSPQDAVQKLIKDFHRPSNIDYRAKFKITSNKEQSQESPANTPAPSPSEPVVPPKYDMLTLSKAAVELGITTTEMEDLLIKKCYLFRDERDYLMLSDTGKSVGIRFRKSRGYYFLVPKTLLSEF